MICAGPDPNHTILRCWVPGGENISFLLSQEKGATISLVVHELRSLSSSPYISLSNVISSLAMDIIL